MIYLDNAATTKPSKGVIKKMTEVLENDYGNPSSVYHLASESRRIVDEARNEAADLIGAKPSEIFFTSGGSESDNWALNGILEALGPDKNHIVTTRIEHHAILRTCEYLESKGVRVTYLPVSEEGLVDPSDVEEAIGPDTALVSVMTANNEIGTIEPVEAIGRICRDHHVLFHTDAVQAYGHIPIDVNRMNIDLLSASAHKLGGPKGCGLLFIREGVPIRSLIRGGAQERGRRAGTENVPGIAGFGEAALEAKNHLEERMERTKKLRDYAIGRILSEIPETAVNGSRTVRLPGNINVTVRGAEGQLMLILLDRAGIAASSGSACSSGSLDPSHVLTSIGKTEEEAKDTLRLTLSHENTKEEIDEAVDALKRAASSLRKGM